MKKVTYFIWNVKDDPGHPEEREHPLNFRIQPNLCPWVYLNILKGKSRRLEALS